MDWFKVDKKSKAWKVGYNFGKYVIGGVMVTIMVLVTFPYIIYKKFLVKKRPTIVSLFLK